MNTLRKILNAIMSASDHDSVMDHVPANKIVLPKDEEERKAVEAKMAAKLAELRAEAERRHGRKFRCDKIVARETEPSHDLREIMKKAPATAANVAKRHIAGQR